jgi:hypothetical protein
MVDEPAQPIEAAQPIEPALPVATPAPEPAAPIATPAAPIPPTEPVAEPAPPLERAKPPRVGESITGALDLCLAASRQIRAVSVYVGLLALVIAGPAIVLVLGLVRRAGSFDAMLDMFGPRGIASRTQQPAPIILLEICGFLAAIGVFALLIEAEIVTAAILGAAAAGRRMRLRDSLRLSRRVFWQVIVASILVGIVGQIATYVIGEMSHPRSAADVQEVYIVQVIVAAIVTAPFAFFLTGIVVGGVGPIETLKRSVKIAAARWRLAILVASAGSVVSIIEVFALGAGLDLIVRFSTAAGLTLNGSPATAVVTVAIVLVGLVAFASLLVTVAALIAAPQVFVFVRMTGYTGGLDRALPRQGSVDRARLVTRPMILLIAFTVLAGVVGLRVQ